MGGSLLIMSLYFLGHLKLLRSMHISIHSNMSLTFLPVFGMVVVMVVVRLEIQGNDVMPRRRR